VSDYSAAERVKIEKLLADFMGGTYAQKPELYKQGSPIACIRADWPPLFLAHGEKDELVPIAQVDRFYRAVENAGLTITYSGSKRPARPEPGRGNRNEPDPCGCGPKAAAFSDPLPIL
jgi:hypothetical protein